MVTRASHRHPAASDVLFAFFRCVSFVTNIRRRRFSADRSCFSETLGFRQLCFGDASDRLNFSIGKMKTEKNIQMCEVITFGLRAISICCNTNFRILATTVEDRVCKNEEMKTIEFRNVESSDESLIKRKVSPAPEPEKSSIDILSDYFQEYVHTNNSSALGMEHMSAKLLSCFRGNKPGFDASYYVKRISKYSGVHSSSFVVANIYLERMKTRFPSVLLTTRTLQRLLLVAVMIANKYLEDRSCLNTRW